MKGIGKMKPADKVVNVPNPMKYRLMDRNKTEVVIIFALLYIFGFYYIIKSLVQLLFNNIIYSIDKYIHNNIMMPLTYLLPYYTLDIPSISFNDT